MIGDVGVIDVRIRDDDGFEAGGNRVDVAVLDGLDRKRNRRKCPRQLHAAIHVLGDELGKIVGGGTVFGVDEIVDGSRGDLIGIHAEKNNRQKRAGKRQRPHETGTDHAAIGHGSTE